MMPRDLARSVRVDRRSPHHHRNKETPVKRAAGLAAFAITLGAVAYGFVALGQATSGWCALAVAFGVPFAAVMVMFGLLRFEDWTRARARERALPGEVENYLRNLEDA
jgi:fatty acid desaturase